MTVAGAVIWRASRTPNGVATLALRETSGIASKPWLFTSPAQLGKTAKTGRARPRSSSAATSVQRWA